MEFRPIGDTIREVMAWHAERGPDYAWTAYGMKPEREATLLAAWNGQVSTPDD